tara:strand:- start:1928 stop:2368 length:441 start_codon:yes stop_codon:yes gene_type:complete
MKNTVFNFILAGVLAALPLAAYAQLDPPTSCEQVEDMLSNGSSSAEVVNAMIDSGMALTGATVFAMECADAQYRIAIAEAGVGLASNLNEARGVVRAVADAYGESSDETNAARKAFEASEKMAKQPKEYKSDFTPQGGGADVSPST